MLRVNLILRVLTTKIPKGHKETLGGTAHVYYLDCGDGIMGVSIYSNSLNNYTLNIFSSLYINYTSIKLSKTFKKYSGPLPFFETSGT